jgi:hypothetical protein
MRTGQSRRFGRETNWLRLNKTLIGYHQEKESISKGIARTRKRTFFSLIKSLIVEVGWDAGSASITPQNAKEGHSLILCG